MHTRSMHVHTQPVLGKIWPHYSVCFVFSVPVFKPRLTHTCTDASVSLRCDVANSVDVNVVWSHNRQTLPGSTDKTLTITKAMLKPVDRYVCTVSNKASEEKSDDVNPECTGA